MNIIAIKKEKDATQAQGPTPNLPDKLISQKDLATMFGVAPVTVRLWVRQGRLPQPIRVGRAPHWAPDVIARFLGAQGSEA